MTRRLATAVVVALAAEAAQAGPRGSFGGRLPPGRPFPWAEVAATVLLISLLLWAAHLRREE